MTSESVLMDKNYTLGLHARVKESNHEIDPFIILSNNTRVINEFENSTVVEGDYIDVLYKAKELIQEGHSLLSYPNGASIRIMFSPVRSILLSKNKEEFDQRSLETIEEGIEKYKLTLGQRTSDTRNKEDYKIIDYDLLVSAIEEYDFVSKLLNF